MASGGTCVFDAALASLSSSSSRVGVGEAPAVEARRHSFAAPRYVCLVHTQVRGTLDLNGPVLGKAAGAVVVVPRLPPSKVLR